VVDSKEVEGLAIEIVEEPAVIAALEGEKEHHEEVGDGTVGEVIYRRTNQRMEKTYDIDHDVRVNA
jgi:hypothetical protein